MVAMGTYCRYCQRYVRPLRSGHCPDCRSVLIEWRQDFWTGIIVGLFLALVAVCVVYGVVVMDGG